MAKYREILAYIKQTDGRTAKTCWIAHVKELNGMPGRAAPNRISASVRQNPCPPKWRPIIEEAMRHFGML